MILVALYLSLKTKVVLKRLISVLVSELILQLIKKTKPLLLNCTVLRILHTHYLLYKVGPGGFLVVQS